MNYYLFLLRKNLAFFLVGISLVIAASALIIVVKTQSLYKEPFLIAIDGNGTRIITRKDDPIFETEVVGFLRNFLENLYNFSPSTFILKVGSASELMSPSLWEQKEAQILELKELVKKQEISTQALVSKISKVSNEQYAAIVFLTENSRLQKVDRTLKILMKVSKVPRSTKNPWGMEMAQYEEQTIQSL